MSVLARIGAIICVVVADMALVILSAPSAECASSVDVWTIKQQSCTLGDIEVLVNDSAFRWKNPKSGLTISTRAPKWQFCAYNDVNKKYMLLTPADMLQLLNKKKSNKPEKWPIISGTSTIAGIPVVRMINPSNMEVPKAVAMKFYEATKSNRKLDAKQAQLVDKSLKDAHDEIWVARNIAVPAAAVSLLTDNSAASFSPHVFIRMITVTKKGVTRVQMDTQSVRRSKVSAAVFDPPNGYKKAESQIALFVDDSEFEDYVPQPPSKTVEKK